MLKIHSIESLWAHEWPWIRTVFFLQWCDFKCLYCHNPDTITKKWWKNFSDNEIIDIVEKNKIYFWKKWWVTFSWWEPLLQAKQMINLLKKLKNLWVNITIDTNGSILNDEVKELLKYTDLILLDIKQINEDKHKKLTWISNKNSLDSLEYLEKHNKKYWIRYVLLPWYTDNEQDIDSLWKYLKKYKNMERFEILPYHTLWIFKWKDLKMKYELDNINQPTKESLEITKKTLQKYIKKIYIRQ